MIEFVDHVEISRSIVLNVQKPLCFGRTTNENAEHVTIRN